MDAARRFFSVSFGVCLFHEPLRVEVVGLDTLDVGDLVRNTGGPHDVAAFFE